MPPFFDRIELHNVNAEKYQAILTIVCAITSVLTILICLALLIHIVNHTRDKQKKGICNYLRTVSPSTRMLIAYLITAMVTAAIYGFIRNNVFTRVNVEYFTVGQCAIGYFLGIAMAGINRICLYFLFLFRIRSVFRNSAYEYSAKTYRRIVISIISIYSIIAIIGIYIFSQSMVFELNIYGRKSAPSLHENTPWIQCGHRSPSDGYLKWLNIGWFVLSLIIEVSIYTLFLGMFIKGLYGLKLAIMSNHKSLHNVFHGINSVDIAQGSTDTVTDMPADMVIALELEAADSNKSNSIRKLSNSNRNGKKQNRPRFRSQMGFHELMARYSEKQQRKSKKALPTVSTASSESTSSGSDSEAGPSTTVFVEKQSIRTMVKLHHLTKKRTILALIAIVSSCVYWIVAAAVDPWFSILVSVDISINAVCGWLMLKSSEFWWFGCIRYGFCRCCYKKLDDQYL